LVATHQVPSAENNPSPTALAASRSAPWFLVLLGDGPLRGELEGRISELGIRNSVLLPGFKQYSDLPTYYGLAGAFVHVSTTEQWGLVVNEAMASGLPVLVSNRCGCATDLVEVGRNGFTFDPGDFEALSRLVLQVASPACNRTAMGQASRERVQRWGPDAFARGLQNAVQTALRGPTPRISLLDHAMLRALIWR
jgi:glycosyltransferase involved in cell wall biosynthesis